MVTLEHYTKEKKTPSTEGHSEKMKKRKEVYHVQRDSLRP